MGAEGTLPAWETLWVEAQGFEVQPTLSRTEAITEAEGMEGREQKGPARDRGAFPRSRTPGHPPLKPHLEVLLEKLGR